MKPSHILIVDIDGLRPDVFESALLAGQLPNFARMFGQPERRFSLRAYAPAPSITFTSQASLFTGAHPGEHGIAGNQYYDRFGQHSQGIPRHYAFDSGDMLGVDDAVRVFVDGLASKCLTVPTIYEYLSRMGWTSVVASHMYARGATQWLRPNLAHLARLTKGGHLFGMTASEYDRRTLDNTLEYLGQNEAPNILTVYFMGVDHESHHHGPQAQAGYLTGALDGYLGELWDALEELLPAEDLPAVAVVSDHGQIGVPADDRHSLRMAFPFERELKPFFDALGLDVHDFPGEDPNCDAVVACNGGMAQVYLQNRAGRWATPPDFERDVLGVAKALWEAHQTGRYAHELEGSLAGVLVRQVEKDRWGAKYRALTPQGEQVSLQDWFAGQPGELYADPVHRLDHFAGPFSGDILLISNYAEGYYFAGPLAGVHGGLHPQDSAATLCFGWSAAPVDIWQTASRAIEAAVEQRCRSEGGRQASTADLWLGLKTLIAD